MYKKEGVGPSLCREAPCPEWLGGRMGAGEGRSPRGRSWEVLGTDLGPEWPEGREQGGRTKGHRERFGLIYPESGRKLAGFHAGM